MTSTNQPNIPRYSVVVPHSNYGDQRWQVYDHQDHAYIGPLHYTREDALWYMLQRVWADRDDEEAPDHE